MAKWPINSFTAYFIFHFWVASSWRFASALDRQHGFDLLWQLTYGTFRAPSSLWRVGKPFVIGPVGGGETAPISLLKGMQVIDALKEILRLAVIRTAAFAPGFNACYRNVNLVIARTPDTQRALPKWARNKCHIEQEIGGWPQPFFPKTRTGSLNIIFAGRLLAWKGVHFALEAFSNFLGKGGEGVLTIVGDGPQAETLKLQSKRLGLSDAEVVFIPRIPQTDLFDLYRKQDVLLFPSLHDSGGNVVVEAMSFGLAVVCLDLGGPQCFVSSDCGYVIPTFQRTREQVEFLITESLLELHHNPALLKNMSDSAWRRASNMSYADQIRRVTSLATSVIYK